MAVKPDTKYFVLHYGTLAFPVEMFEQVVANLVYVDRQYTSDSGMVYRVENQKNFEVIVLDSNELIASTIADRLEK